MSPFENIPEERIIWKGAHFFVVEDLYPVSPGHMLIISNEPKKDFFDLTPVERSHLHFMIDFCRKTIERDHTPDGYNIGMNCGEAAGQTVMHFHCHVIPRYKGDMEDPRGGVRGVIPEKQKY